MVLQLGGEASLQDGVPGTAPAKVPSSPGSCAGSRLLQPNMGGNFIGRGLWFTIDHP